MNGWLNDLSLTWPFSANDSDFFVVLHVLGVLFAAMGVLIASMVGNQLDGPVRTTDNTASMPSSTLPTAVALSSSSLVVGRLPVGEERWLLAWVAGGRRRLETTLFVAGVRAGWIRTEGAQIVVVPDVEPADPVLARFKLALHRTVMTSREPVHAAGAEIAPMVHSMAIEREVARTGTRHSALIMLSMGGALVLLVLQLLHIAMGPSVRNIAMLFFATTVIAPWVASAGLASLATIMLVTRHRQAQAYVRWLDSVVGAVKDDVVTGVATRDDDIVMTAALVGARGLGLTNERHRIVASLEKAPDRDAVERF